MIVRMIKLIPSWSVRQERLNIMFASYLSVASAQQQVSLIQSELARSTSMTDPTSRQLVLSVFLHQINGLSRIWSTYSHSLLSTLHSCSLAEQQAVFEPGSAPLRDFQLVVEETRTRLQEAHCVVDWLTSIHLQLLLTKAN